MHFELTPIEVGEFDINERRTLERRLATYTESALRVALEVDRIFVNHPEFQNVLSALDRAFELGRDFSVPHGVFVSGPTGSGKSTVAKFFIAALPASTRFEFDLGVISVRLQERPALGRIVGHLLTKLRYPFPRVADNTIGAKRTALIECLRRKGTRMVIFDEAGHMCGSSVRGVRDGGCGNEVTEFVRELLDEAQVAVVLCADVPFETLAKADSALAARVVRRECLSDFRLNNVWYGFLDAFRRKCTGIDLSFLCEPPQVSLVHCATKGNLRLFKMLATEVALVAVDRGQKSINQEILAEAFSRVNGAASVTSNPFKRGTASAS